MAVSDSSGDAGVTKGGSMERPIVCGVDGSTDPELALAVNVVRLRRCCGS